MKEHKLRVPTRDRHGDLLSAELRDLWVDLSIQLFCKLFGGCEVSSAQGNWVDDGGRLHKERITLLSSIGPEEENSTLRQHCKRMAAALNQECVMLSTHSGCTAEFIGG